MQTPKARPGSLEVPQKTSPQKASPASLEVPQKTSPRKASPGPLEVPQKTSPASLEVPQKTSPRKASPGPLEVPQKTSPHKASPATSRTARQLKTTGLESESASSQPASRTPKDRSPKVPERRSPRSPVSEKKRPSRLSELESQLTHLQEDLKKTKDQLVSSETSKKHALQESDEAKKQVIGLTEKLEESQHQLLELSASEESRIQELRKLSQERDKAWESELDAVRKQNSVDSAALSSALNEIQNLKIQLEKVVESEGLQTKYAEKSQAEIQSLQHDLAETQSLVENLKTQLENCRESEAQAQAMVRDTLHQLEIAKITVETLQSDGIKTIEAYKLLSLELEQSKDRVNSLEELVSELKTGLSNVSSMRSSDTPLDKQALEMGEICDSVRLKVELTLLKSEIKELTSALEAAEIRYQEGQIKSTVEIRSAYEVVEAAKSKAALREAELETELKKTKSDIEELKANLMDKETELQSISEENEGLNMKIEKNQSGQGQAEMEIEVKKSKEDIAEFKARLMDKETELQNISEENEILKSEIKRREMEKDKVNHEAISEAEAARAAEREALMRLGYVTEEADKNSRRAARVSEHLEAAQAAHSEMEAELRRIKVQSDQWRKAAEAAAAVLSAGNNGNFMDRSGSLDSNNYHPVTGKICSPYSEDMDDDSPKKKNNMLKKFGGLWKKGQK